MTSPPGGDWLAAERLRYYQTHGHEPDENAIHEAYDRALEAWEAAKLAEAERNVRDD